MDVKVLNKVSEILKYKIDKMEMEMSFLNKEIQATYRDIVDMTNQKFNGEGNMEISSSISWITDYKRRLIKSIYEKIHIYANQRNNLNLLKLKILSENQKKDAISQIVENKRRDILFIKQIKEEEDVEELCAAKQYF
ncbi:MAG: hypothetical protein QW076_01760 [Candidatus Anstonellales archaeon]